MTETDTGPDRDGAAPQSTRVEETVSDQTGRLVATRVGAEPGACTTYCDDVLLVAAARI